MGRTSGLPPNVSEFRDRHGKWRLRFRAKGRPTFYFTAVPGTEQFRIELEACRAGTTTSTAERSALRARPGSISALIMLYYGTPAFTGLAESSKKTYRSTLERFRAKHGDKDVRGLERKHIKAILGGMSATPAAANKLLDKLSLLMELAVDEEWRADDPTIGIKAYRIKSDGFHTWTEEEIAQYEERHALGTRARLAADILLYTGQRRSDGIKAGRQHVSAGRISVAQQKTSKRLSIRMHPKLIASIEAAAAAGIVGDLTYLVTELGQPFTSAGFGNKMRDWCDAAGLPQCTAHGLRKAAARRLAEAGCSHAQIKAITGHTTDGEVARYIAAANQRTLADQAMDALDQQPSPAAPVG